MRRGLCPLGVAPVCELLLERARADQTETEPGRGGGGARKDGVQERERRGEKREERGERREERGERKGLCPGIVTAWGALLFGGDALGVRCCGGPGG